MRTRGGVGVLAVSLFTPDVNDRLADVEAMRAWSNGGPVSVEGAR